jgi:pyruvate/2-oxoglutarate dehydrogenase complex dihydrolipoamide acyltransferase (E2) component
MMADIEVKLPPLGKDAPDEATVSFFYVKEGAAVKEGEDFCEMVTDKATFNVPSTVTGTVKKIVAKEDDLVAVGGILAIVEVN